MAVMVNRDAEHLKLLSIFHYVLGGLLCFFGLFPLIYVGMGFLFLSIPEEEFSNVGPAIPTAPAPTIEESPLETDPDLPDFEIVEEPNFGPVQTTPAPGPTFNTRRNPGPPPGFQRTVGFAFIGIGLVLTLVMVTIALLIIFAGYKLGRASNWTFCFVVACLECLWMPLGTVLGVFTLVVLCRNSVKDRFQGRYQDPDPTDTAPPPLPG